MEGKLEGRDGVDEKPDLHSVQGSRADDHLEPPPVAGHLGHLLVQPVYELLVSLLEEAVSLVQH